MALLTGLTSDGLEVPVQVKPDGKLVAEGLTGPAGGVGPQGVAGPAGPKGDDKWTGDVDISYMGGKVGIGVTSLTANGGVLQLKGGITFPATAVASTDPNTLDGYEEGVWTPTDDSGAGLSFTVSNCRYTKIGRAVAIQGTITYPSTANTNNAGFTSFPFAAADNITLSVIYTDASVANFTYLSSNTATCFLLTPGLNVINATMSGKSFTFAGVYAI